MKRPMLLGLLITACIISSAQSKVFKEINEEVSSEMKIITQDDALVGYLVFTQLEKATEDSFNYKISLLDENLNDIGTVNFREEFLEMEAVSFEQDILCLVYVKSNAMGREFKSRKEFDNFDTKNSIFTQFLTLDGKIIKTNEKKIIFETVDDVYIGGPFARKANTFKYTGRLKHRVQLKNISQEGFVCFYGDKYDRTLVAYDLTGKELWDKDISTGSAFGLLTSKKDIYLLEKTEGRFTEGGYYISSFNSKDGTAYEQISLVDKNENPLKVLGWGNDPVTGIPYVSGNIIDKSKDNSFYTPKQLAKGAYAGVFTIDITGHTKKEIKQTFTYWKDGSQSAVISSKGKVNDTRSFVQMSGSFRDFNGNTYFIGSELVRRPKAVGIAVSALFSAIAFIPPFTPGALASGPVILLFTGTTKAKFKDATVMKLTSKGNLSYETSIPCHNSKFIGNNKFLNQINADRTYYATNNPDTKSSFIIAEDAKNIRIYNVKKKKVVRTIDQKDGKIRTSVFPAKEGHIMIVETNKKEKYTRLSIEALN